MPLFPSPSLTYHPLSRFLVLRHPPLVNKTPTSAKLADYEKFLLQVKYENTTTKYQ